MRAALFSKMRSEKQWFVSDFIQRAGGSVIVYVFPKNRKGERLDIPGAYNVTYEDITRKACWLRINSLIDENSVLILENPSRYPRISSEKFRHLYRLCMHVGHRAVVDVVPFTLDIKYLYTPFCYLGRDILGYSHYYAFRENYHEMGEDGKVHASHDFDVLAAKMAGVSTVTYPRFLCSDRRTVKVKSTPDEIEQYAKYKTELFSKEKSPQRIITRLADIAHAFQSRRDALLDLLPSLIGETVIYTNLGTFARRIRQAVKRSGVTVTSYQMGSTEHFQNCIYFESPIVKSYFLLDAESRLSDDCRVFHFLGDTGVDRYLYGELQEELTQIDGLTKELYRETKEKGEHLQALLEQDSVGGSDGADRVDFRHVQDGERIHVRGERQLSLI